MAHHTRRRRRGELKRRGMNQYGNTMANVGGYKRKKTRRRHVWY